MATPSYSTAEVARLLGVSIPTVQRWTDQGLIKAWKTPGGHRRLDADSVKAFVRDQGLTGSVRLSVPEPAPAAAAAVGAGTVLIVDDNPDDRDLLCTLVESAWPGARVEVAENGFQALLSIGRATPRVLVSDLMMPHMNGLEMLRYLRDAGARRPAVIIAVSSETPQRLAHLGGLPRELRFVQKPIDPAVFAQVLHDGLSAAGIAAPLPRSH